MIGVERVDYIRVPVDDIEQARRFYSEVLGLRENPNSPHDDWVEYEAGDVTLAVMTPHTHDYEFAALPPATIALRVRDVAAAKARLEAAGLEVGEMWTRAPAAAQESATRPATASSSTVGTRRTGTARRRDARHEGRRRRRALDRWEALPSLLRRHARPTARRALMERVLDRRDLLRDLVPGPIRRRVRAAGEQHRAPSRRRRRRSSRSARGEGRGVRRRDLDTGVCHMASFRDPDGNPLTLHRRYAPYSDGPTP